MLSEDADLIPDWRVKGKVLSLPMGKTRCSCDLRNFRLIDLFKIGLPFYGDLSYNGFHGELL